VSQGVLPFRLIFTVSFRVTVCSGLGIGLESGLDEMGLGEMGQNRVTDRRTDGWTDGQRTV